MPNDTCVINTGPLIALALGFGSWSILDGIDLGFIIPEAVLRELRAGPHGAPGRDLQPPTSVAIPSATDIPIHLLKSLDPGEAAVIGTAISQGASLVAIDELAGRRVARLHGLAVTGSLGLVLRACRLDAHIVFDDIVARMLAGGIHYSTAIIERAKTQLG